MRWILLFLFLVPFSFALDSVSLSHSSSASYYLNMKDADVLPLSSSYYNFSSSSSFYVYVMPNPSFETVVYLDIANKSYYDFLYSNMKNRLFSNTTYSKRIIVNNESTGFFGFDSIYVLHYGSMTFIRPSSCLVVSLNNTVYIYGNSIVGIVNGLSLFLDNEAKFLNSDYVAYFDDKSLEGLKRWDLYINNNKNVSLLFSSYYVSNMSVLPTMNGLSHRVRHFSSLLSTKYINGTIGSSTDSIVIACGLWSNISSWDNLALDLVSSGYDVWQIEITGGPFTECSTCYNYDYTYLTDYAWPTMIGYIQANTLRNITYVGHSNGGRTALSSLDRWGDTGRAFNDSNFYNMSSRPIRQMIGVAIPGAFEGEGNLFAEMLASKGNEILNYNKDHLTLKEVAYFILFNFSRKDDSNRISKSLLYDYYEFANKTNDLQPGFNTTLDQFYIIYSGYGTPLTKKILVSNDEIVSFADEMAIFDNIISLNKNKTLLINKIHDQMTKDKEVNDLVKKRIRNE